MLNLLIVIVFVLFLGVGAYSFFTFRRWIKEAAGLTELSPKLMVIVCFASVYVPIAMLDLIKMTLKGLLILTGH